MAEINREAEELARIMAQVNLEMNRYGQLTKETADKKKDLEFRAATGLHNITEATDKGADAVINLGKAMMGAASSMYQGKKGAAAFNSSVDSLTTAAKAAAAGLLLLGGPLGLLAAAVMGGIAALGAYTKAANEMGDKLYEGYQGLAESGAAASDGMTGLFEDAKKLGLSMGELGKYTELIGANSKDLALLSSSVFEGRKRFADMGKAMEPFKESLMNAGLSQDQINAGSMQYLRLQTRIGQSQNKTTTELAEGARKYLIEQDALTKLTGATRKDNEAALEEARSQQRFRAKLDAMRSSGDAGQIAAADELEKTYVLLRSQSKQAAQGFGDLTTGMMNTEAAQKLSMSTNAEAQQVAGKMVAGQIKAIDGTQQIASAAGRVTKDFNMLYQTGVGEDFLLPIKEGAELGLLAQKDLNKSYEQIKEDQKKQGQEGGAAADKLVAAQTKLRIAQQAGNEATERFVLAGVEPATKAMTILAKTTTAGVDSLNKLFGITPSKETPGAPRGPDLTKATAELDASTEKAKLANERAAAAEKDANLTRAEKDRVKKEARESEAAVMQDVFKQREAQLREQNARRAARRAGTAAPAGGGAAPAAGGAAPAAGGGAAPAAAGGGAAAPAAPVPTGPSGTQGEAATPVAPKAAQVLSFGSGSGSQQNFAGLDDRLESAVTKAAEQYNATTGKKIQINSAKRDPEKQKELYDAWIAGGKQGMPVAAPGTSLHEKGLAVDIQNYNDPSAVAAMNQQGLKQKVPNDPVHFSFDGGGVIKGPETGYKPNLTLHGEEAFIPLKDGAVPVSLNLKDALSGPTFAGMNEYAGYNMGPITTDIDAVKKLAEAVGAFDKTSQIITDPATWKQILSSGLATNYNLVNAELGTKSLPGLDQDMADRLKEIKEQGNTTTEAALKQVGEELKIALSSMAEKYAVAMTSQALSINPSEITPLLQELVSATKNGVDVQQKILATNY
jgi:hypothetical protein